MTANVAVYTANNSIFNLRRPPGQLGELYPNLKSSVSKEELELVNSISKLRESAIELLNTSSIFGAITGTPIVSPNGSIPKSIQKVFNIVTDMASNLYREFSTTFMNLSKLEKRQKCEFIITMGGLDAILLFLSPPPGMLYISAVLEKYHVAFTQLFVVIRELIYPFASIVLHSISKYHMHCLFNLMVYPTVFEACVSLSEEIFAAKTDCLDLTEIPKVDVLFNQFNPRQLAIMCRLWSLLLFEPEERANMEGCKVS